MTREAKIGMLTGLGVIVLIGVLLSEYLGGGAGAHGRSPTGRMAELPMGAAYRQEVTDPVGVPGMTRTDGATGTDAAGSQTVTASAGNLPTGSPSMPAPVTSDPTGAPTMGSLSGAPTMELGDRSAGGQGTAVAFDAGQGKAAGTPETITFGDNTTAAGAIAPVKGTEYVIAPGDTLNKIAAKFFKSNKSEGIKQIVAANPALLKDDKAMLISGKKLIIPTVAASPKVTVNPPAAVAPAKKPAAVVIHQPGSAAPAAPVNNGDAGTASAETAKPAASKVYVVQSGDTLEKIAKKVSPSNVSAMVKKIEEANGIKDPTGLKVGQKLKVPTA